MSQLRLKDHFEIILCGCVIISNAFHTEHSYSIIFEH